MRVLAIAFLLTSCGSIANLEEAPKMRPPFVTQVNEKPIDFPFSCYRFGEILEDGQDYWDSKPYKELSFHTYERYGDLTREYGNVTFGYARISPNKNNGRDLCTDVFDTREIDEPYGVTTVHINEEYIIVEAWGTESDPILRFFVYSNDCLQMEGVKRLRNYEGDQR